MSQKRPNKFQISTGQGRSRNPVVDVGADQRPRLSRPPTLDAGRGPGGHGGSPGSAPARENRNVESRSSHQHILGRFFSGTKISG